MGLLGQQRTKVTPLGGTSASALQGRGWWRPTGSMPRPPAGGHGGGDAGTTQTWSRGGGTGRAEPGRQRETAGVGASLWHVCRLE